ncbi:intercellular adhesion molecule 5 isoform X1 [Sander lucioperca]|uniref:intercellular adhesion molecule 5 isoform X1 n=1 Tax=Sander lucioperca TaxID=283035 RepID=UPI00125E4F65|nr:intercellular adhesion molecule 5 isoform X1 [Sander lucioperca]
MLPLRMLGFLILMFSLCDADRLCPSDINPLTLDPPEVIKEYEESVFINCTSTEEDHAGMYWTVGNTNSAMEYDNSYIQAPLSNWDVAAECKIKLNDTHECSKDLKITVYKNPEMVSLFPTRYVPTVERTLFELQCDIIDVAPVQNLTVRWYKNNQAIRIDSFTNITKTPVNESSTLAVNISREENGAEFRCEAQLDFGSHGSQPVTSHTYTVAVHYAPELKNKTEDVYVNEYNDVTLNCDAEGHPPPHFHWTCDGLNILENTNNLKITRVISSTTCNCTATNNLGSINKQIHVHVIPRGCPLVVTPAEMVVRFGDPASVNCSTDADVQQMGWEAPVGATSTPGPAVIWTVEKLEDWQINPLCVINLKDTYQCSKNLTITLYKTPDIVSVSVLYDGPMVEGTEYHLKCDIINVAPVQNLTVRWYKNNQAIRIDSFTNTTKTPVNESSTLAVNISREENGAEFRCEAQLDFGSHGSQPVTSHTYTVAVHYAPELKNKTEDVYVNEYNDVTLNCDAEGHPPPHFHWTCDGLNILENTNNLKITRVISSTTCNCTATNNLGSINKQIHVHVIPRGCPLVVTPAEMVVRFGDPASVNCSTDADVQQMGWEAPVGATSTPGPAVIWTVEKLEDWQINPLCFINLKDTYQCSKKLNITLYKTPDIVSVSALDNGPMVEGTEYHLKCNIINVAPVQKLKVTWYRGNETVHAEVFNETSKVPANVSSTLRVTPVGDYNGEHFICKADLQLGQNGPETDPTVTSSPYMAVVYYAPVFKEGTDNKEVNLGENVTIDCSAEGNPVPKILLNYSSAVNVKETIRGRQKGISITGATSTNAGVYSCDAINEVGRVTRYVTLTMKGKTSPVSSPTIWWLLIILIAVLILIILISVHSYSKKHGQYSFVPDKANDGSEIPMTPQSNGVQA